MHKLFLSLFILALGASAQTRPNILWLTCEDHSMGIGWIANHILQFPIMWQYVSAFLLLCPIGFLMGLPFPLGMQYLLQNPAQRAYAWSANGCASVLASIASAQIALTVGLPFIMGFAVLAYFIAFLSTLKHPCSWI